MPFVQDKARPGAQAADRRIPSQSIYSTDALPITPSDTVDLNPWPREVYVGGAGTVRLINAAGRTVDFECPAGVYIKQVTKRVLATGTDATLLLGII